jgi:hypothetical protein
VLNLTLQQVLSDSSHFEVLASTLQCLECRDITAKRVHFLFLVSKIMAQTLTSQVNHQVVMTETGFAQGECIYRRVYADVFYLYACAITPVVVIGMVLNILNLIVMRNMQNVAKTSIFLLRVLAVCDLVFLTICFVYFFIRHMIVYFTNRIELFARPDNRIGSLLSFATTPLYYASLMTRNWLIVLITAERFVNIVFPLWARRNCDQGNLIKIAVTIVCFSVVCYGPQYWYRFISIGNNPCTDLTEFVVEFLPIASLMDMITYMIGLYFTPVVLIYTMNIVLIISVRKSTQERLKMTVSLNRPEKSQTQATVTIIALVCLFTICETLPVFDRLMSISGVRFADDSLFYNYGRKVGLVLIVCDSALNFVAYCISNRIFRENLNNLCNRAFCHPCIPK